MPFNIDSELVRKAALAQAKYQELGMRNTYGLSVEEQVFLDAEYAAVGAELSRLRDLLLKQARGS